MSEAYRSLSPSLNIIICWRLMLKLGFFSNLYFRYSTSYKKLAIYPLDFYPGIIYYFLTLAVAMPKNGITREYRQNILFYLYPSPNKLLVHYSDCVVLVIKIMTIYSSEGEKFIYTHIAIFNPPFSSSCQSSLFDRSLVVSFVVRARFCRFGFKIVGRNGENSKNSTGELTRN